MIENQEQRLRIVSTAKSQIDKIVGTQQSRASKIGQIAEPLHCLFFNLDATNKGKSVMAYCDKDPESPVSRNDPLYDILIVDRNDGKPLSSAQLKYHSNFRVTCQNVCISDANTRRFKYIGVDQILVPKEQRAEIKNLLQKKVLKEEYRVQEYNDFSRQNVLADTRQIREAVNDRLEFAGVNSKPLTVSEIGGFIDSDDELNKIFQSVIHTNKKEICAFYRGELFSRPFTSYGYSEIAGCFTADLLENRFAWNKGKTGSVVGIAANSVVQTTLQIPKMKNGEKKEIVTHTLLNLGCACINSCVKTEKGKRINIAAFELAHTLIKIRAIYKDKTDKNINR